LWHFTGGEIATYSWLFVVVDVADAVRAWRRMLKRRLRASSSVLVRKDALSRGGSHIIVSYY